MQGAFNSPFDIVLLSFLPQIGTNGLNANFQPPNNQHIVSYLYSSKQAIEKLLENQIFLKTCFQPRIRAETTDTQYSRYESDYFKGIKKQSGLSKQYGNGILRNKRECSFRDINNRKTTIRIICNQPILQNWMEQQIQQKDNQKQFQNNQQQNKKCCQTKNIIKNYGKSILMFLRKNRLLTKSILDHHSFEETTFYQEIQKFKDKVNSISQLKLFWTQQGSHFAKIFRIMSNIYLKKFSLKHTFSSRVKNYSVHIKYRKRLLDILKHPEQFSSIKYL